jgi:uncharacterized protein YdaU (DUF1376 family)
MSRSPAFQFYPRDYISDPVVQMMSLEERGAYVQLLCAAWLPPAAVDGTDTPVGHLVNDDAELADLSQLGPKWETSRRRILRAFRVSADGRYLYQKRMVEEWKKQELYRVSAAAAGRASAAAKSREREFTNSTPVERPLNGGSTEPQREVNETPTEGQRNVNGNPTLQSASASASAFRKKPDQEKETTRAGAIPVLPDWSIDGVWREVLNKTAGDNWQWTALKDRITVAASLLSPSKRAVDYARELVAAMPPFLLWATTQHWTNKPSLKVRSLVANFERLEEWVATGGPPKAAKDPRKGMLEIAENW